jgi:hypothetical protein
MAKKGSAPALGDRQARKMLEARPANTLKLKEAAPAAPAPNACSRPVPSRRRWPSAVSVIAQLVPHPGSSDQLFLPFQKLGWF